MKRAEVQAVNFTIYVEAGGESDLDHIHAEIKGSVIYSTNEGPHDLTDEEWNNLAVAYDLAEDDDES